MASAQPSSTMDKVLTELEATFRNLVDQWHRDTDHYSSQTQKAMHPGYQRIIGMGPAALPLIFRELEANSGHWFWALRAITGDDPTCPADSGKIEKMGEGWLAYGRERGYL
jgi:hypothetical protein